MNKLTCEMCGGTDLIKQDGVFVCQNCGTKYSLEDAKKMMVEGTVEVAGTVKVDNSSFVQKYIDNARRALGKEDYEEVEKYYNMVEQNSPNNIEAVFFSAYGRVMQSLFETEYYKREQKFKVLNNSISVIDDYYEVTTENKEEVIKKISEALFKMYKSNYLRLVNQIAGVGTASWQILLFRSVNTAFLAELESIRNKHDEQYIDELIEKHENAFKNNGGCYVATCVYESYDCPEVWTLRRFRDDKLAKTWHGRAFIHVYYAISPKIVKLLGEKKWFKKFWKNKLNRMVEKLKEEGFEDTPYQDKEW